MDREMDGETKREMGGGGGILLYKQMEVGTDRGT